MCIGSKEAASWEVKNEEREEGRATGVNIKHNADLSSSWLGTDDRSTASGSAAPTDHGTGDDSEGCTGLTAALVPVWLIRASRTAAACTVRGS